MQIWRSLADVPADLGATVVVIGNFDGVHLGHQRVLARARETADQRGLPVVAVTFDPHPMAVLRPEHAPTQLTTVERRSELLGEAGADHVLALPFDRDMASWTPEEFMRRVLVEAVHAAVTQAFPLTAKRTATASNHGGWSAGRAAADRANLHDRDALARSRRRP